MEELTSEQEDFLLERAREMDAWVDHYSEEDMR